MSRQYEVTFEVTVENEEQVLGAAADKLLSDGVVLTAEAALWQISDQGSPSIERALIVLMDTGETGEHGVEVEATSVRDVTPDDLDRPTACCGGACEIPHTDEIERRKAIIAQQDGGA